MFKDINYYMGLRYPSTLEKLTLEDGGGYMAKHPDLEGCMSDGVTKQEALENLEYAKKDWIEYCLKTNQGIPAPSNAIKL